MDNMEVLNKRTKYTYFEKVSNAYGFFLIVLFPLLFGPKGYADITEAKWNIFRISAYIYLIACGMMILYSAFIARRERIFRERGSQLPFRITISQILVALFMVWNIVSALHSEYGFKRCMLGFGRFEGWLSALLYGAVFICLSFWGEWHGYYVKSLSVAVLVFSLVGFLQFFKGGIIYPQGFTFWNARFMSTLGNADMVAGYVAFVLPILFLTYVLFDFKRWNVVFLVTVGFFSFIFDMANVDSGRMGLLVSLVATLVFIVDSGDHLQKFLRVMGSFTAGLFFSKWLGIHPELVSEKIYRGLFGISFSMKTAVLFLAACVLFGAAYFLKSIDFKYKKSEKEARRIGLVVLVICLLLGLVFVFFYRGSNTLLREASDVLHFKLGDNAGSGRGYIWKTSAKLALKRFWLGYGPGCFGDVYSSYDVLPTYTDFAHNDFLQIAMCTGYASMIVYMLFAASLLLRALKYQNENRALLVLGAAVLSYFVHSFFSFSIAIIQPLLWAGAGILDSQIRYTEAYVQKKSGKKTNCVISLW